MRSYGIFILLILVFCSKRSFGQGSTNSVDKHAENATRYVDVLSAARFLPGKEFLGLDSSRLESLSDDQFLERMQYDYARLCLKEKDSVATVENDAFRINLYCVAVGNGWITREKAGSMILEYLQEFERAKAIRGILPRSFYRSTGENFAGKNYGNFGHPYDIVGTAYFAASAQLIVRQFFDRNDATEKEIRRLCNEICDRIDWDLAYDQKNKYFTWFKNGPDATRFDGKPLIGEMDETFFLQLFVLGAKHWSHSLDAYNNYVSRFRTDTQYGIRYWATMEYNYKTARQFTGIKVNNPEILKQKDYPTAKLGYLVQPHIWFDFKGYRDSICRANDLDYFKNVQNVIKAQIKYARLNPGNYPLYGDVWGFYDTESPVTHRWMETGLPAEGDVDEGTIAINAVMSAMPFAPEEAIKCLRVLYHNFKDKGIYTSSGWVTSVNVSSGKTARRPDMFFAPLDVLLIENYRSGLLWNLAKSAPEYQLAFKKAGFRK